MTEKHVLIDCEAEISQFRRQWEQAMLTMREKHSYDMGESLKRVGKVAIEGGEIIPYIQEYCEAKGKVMILDELLEKIGSE
jgi:hypothetical protein